MMKCRALLTLEKYFYYVNYGSSIIMSQNSPKYGSSFWHFNSHFVSKTKKNTSFCFLYWDYLTNFWRCSWRSIIGTVEKLGSSLICAVNLCCEFVLQNLDRLLFSKSRYCKWTKGYFFKIDWWKSYGPLNRIFLLQEFFMNSLGVL